LRPLALAAAFGLADVGTHPYQHMRCYGPECALDRRPIASRMVSDHTTRDAYSADPAPHLHGTRGIRPLSIRLLSRSPRACTPRVVTDRESQMRSLLEAHRDVLAHASTAEAKTSKPLA
jgi:hypothetical protein